METQDNKEFIASYKALKGMAAFEARTKKGMQPIIEIDGHPFYVNVRIGLLEAKDDFSTTGIDLNKLSVDPDSRNMIGYYDKELREVVAIDPDSTVYPPNVVRIEVPNLFVLDPVGMARRYGKDDDKYYIQDGIRQKMYHKGTMTPLQNELNTDRKMNDTRKQKRGNIKTKATLKRKSRGI